jgi:hypothetical protein
MEPQAPTALHVGEKAHSHWTRGWVSSTGGLDMTATIDTTAPAGNQTLIVHLAVQSLYYMANLINFNEMHNRTSFMES